MVGLNEYSGGKITYKQILVNKFGLYLSMTFLIIINEVILADQLYKNDWSISTTYSFSDDSIQFSNDKFGLFEFCTIESDGYVFCKNWFEFPKIYSNIRTARFFYILSMVIPFIPVWLLLLHMYKSYHASYIQFIYVLVHALCIVITELKLNEHIYVPGEIQSAYLEGPSIYMVRTTFVVVLLYSYIYHQLLIYSEGHIYGPKIDLQDQEDIV